MASHSQSAHRLAARHLAARNTILVGLGGVIAIATLVVLMTYHELRDTSMQMVAPAPLLTKRHPSAPERFAVLKANARRASDSTADVALAHRKAVAAAVNTETAERPMIPGSGGER